MDLRAWVILFLGGIRSHVTEFEFLPARKVARPQVAWYGPWCNGAHPWWVSLISDSPIMRASSKGKEVKGWHCTEFITAHCDLLGIGAIEFRGFGEFFTRERRWTGLLQVNLCVGCLGRLVPPANNDHPKRNCVSSGPWYVYPDTRGYRCLGSGSSCTDHGCKGHLPQLFLLHSYESHCSWKQCTNIGPLAFEMPPSWEQLRWRTLNAGLVIKVCKMQGKPLTLPTLTWSKRCLVTSYCAWTLTIWVTLCKATYCIIEMSLWELYIWYYWDVSLRALHMVLLRYLFH